MDYGLRFTPQDYTAALMQIGQNFGNAYQRNRLGNALSGPGTMEEKIQTLLSMGRIDEATKLQAANSLANYRTIQGDAAQSNAAVKAEPSLEERLAAPYLGAGNVEPFRLGPTGDVEAGIDAEEAEASGRPRDPRYAPEKIQPYLLPGEKIKQYEAVGKGAGERASFKAGLAEGSPQAQEVIDTLIKQAQDADPNTFENALGPWQGASAPADENAGGFFEMLGRQVPQQTGALQNYIEGGEGFTSTVRDNIKGTSATLINLFQRQLRVPGIGSQSEKELQQLIDQAGNLTASKNKRDYYDRLSNVVKGMHAMGYNVSVADIDQLASVNQGSSKIADQLPNEEAPQSAPASAGGYPEPRKVKTTAYGPDGQEIPQTIGEGADARTVTKAPPKPPQKALNALKAYINNPQYREEAIAKFESIYGPGSAQLYLGLGGR